MLVERSWRKDGGLRCAGRQRHWQVDDHLWTYSEESFVPRTRGSGRGRCSARDSDGSGVIGI